VLTEVSITAEATPEADPQLFASGSGLDDPEPASATTTINPENTVLGTYYASRAENPLAIRPWATFNVYPEDRDGACIMLDFRRATVLHQDQDQHSEREVSPQPAENVTTAAHLDQYRYWYHEESYVRTGSDF
jgi:hypothetical protein